MREATGELNMSLVVITLVAGLLAFFYGVIWPNINRDQEHQSKCSNAVCEKKPDDNGMVKCTPKGGGAPITCKYKG